VTEESPSGPPTFQFRPATMESFFKNWPSDWPDKRHFASQHGVTRDQGEGLRELVEGRASETQIEEFLSRNPEVLSLVAYIYSTGHHAAWIYPKHQICPPSGAFGGLIPDYILAGANSGGVSWFILELKGANHPAFVKKRNRVYLSPEANQGVCQLLSYIDYASSSQSYLRDLQVLTGFREPQGILLIGTEKESEDEQTRLFKAAWNRMNPRLQIRSYHSLLHKVYQKLNDFGR
jgi:Domain of unknown function (DUF4263)